MSKLPMLTARELIKLLERLGFRKVRQKGSHIFFQHRDGRTTVVPYHPSKQIGKGLLRSILHDIQISPEEFLKLKQRKN